MKKKCWLLCLFVPLSLFTFAYQLVWEENFEEDSLQTSIWNVENNSRGGGNAEMQYYSPENVKIERHPSGVQCLVIEAQAENYKHRPATSGRVNTQDKMSFQYGKLEVRVHLPNTANGLWPAIWFLGSNAVRDFGNDDSNDQLSAAQKADGRVVWPKCGEIDLVEMGHADGIKNGTQDRLFNGACHWGEAFNKGNYPNKIGPSTASTSLQDDFHIFTLLWTPDSIAMYLDKDINPAVAPYFVLSIQGDGADNHPSKYFHQPFYMLMNLAVGGNFTGLPAPEKYPKKIDAQWKNFQTIVQTALPADGTPVKMYVDYIRLYQRGEVGEQFNLSHEY